MQKIMKKSSGFVALIFMLALIMWPVHELQAVEKSPQWFSLEVKFGEYLPLHNSVKDFLGTCCNERYEVEFGVLYDSKYGAELGVGVISEKGQAIGSGGEESQESFRFTMIPVQLNLAYRADYKENQLFVPYIKGGPDIVFFTESLSGNSTSGKKFGLHGTLGLQILLEFWGEGDDMELEWGVNDVYLTLEGEYSWVNNFRSSSLDLTGLIFSLGFLFEF